MAIVVTIGGSATTIDEGTLSIVTSADAIGRLSVDVTSEDGTVRPANGDDIVVTQNGSRVFGGVIESVTERGVDGVGLAPITTSVTALDFNVLLDRRFVTAEIPAGTMKAALVAVAPYLAVYGVSLYAFQVDGPALPALSYLGTKLTDVIADIKRLSGGYIIGIDYFKTLKTSGGPSRPDPLVLTEEDRIIDGDLVIDETRADYANRVLMRCGPDGVGPDRYTHTWTADGVTAVYSLLGQNVPASNTWPGVVRINGGSLPIWPAGLGGANDIEWDYATSGGTLTFKGTSLALIPNGASIAIDYYPQFPFWIQAPFPGSLSDEPGPFDPSTQAATIGSLSAEQTAHGLWECVASAPDCLVYASGLDLAAAELETRVASVSRVARYSTFMDGIRPGQPQYILSPMRHVDASFTVQSVTARDEFGRMRYDVVAVEGNTMHPTWRDTYARWSGGVTQAARTFAGSVVVDPAGNAIRDGIETAEFMVRSELPTGSINGSNTAFSTSQAFEAGTLRAYLNGLRERFISETGASTFTFQTAPVTGDSVVVDYVRA